MTRLVVFAWGNPGRGDDALGPAFLDRARAIAAPPGVDVDYVDDFQLAPEHATDLEGRDLALFVDAGTGSRAPFEFAAVTPRRDRSFTSHAMSPGAVLAAYADAFSTPPPAFVLAIRGDRYELFEPMGARARRNLRHALEFYRGLLDDATASGWTRVAEAGERGLVARM